MLDNDRKQEIIERILTEKFSQENALLATLNLDAEPDECSREEAVSVEHTRDAKLPDFDGIPSKRRSRNVTLQRMCCPGLPRSKEQYNSPAMFEQEIRAMALCLRQGFRKLMADAARNLHVIAAPPSLEGLQDPGLVLFTGIYYATLSNLHPIKNIYNDDQYISEIYPEFAGMAMQQHSFYLANRLNRLEPHESSDNEIVISIAPAGLYAKYLEKQTHQGELQMGFDLLMGIESGEHNRSKIFVSPPRPSKAE